MQRSCRVRNLAWVSGKMDLSSHVLGVIIVTVTLRSLHASTLRTAVIKPCGRVRLEAIFSLIVANDPHHYVHHRKMYIGAAAAAQLVSSNSNEFSNKDHLEWLENAMKVSWEFIVNIVNVIIAWLVPSLSWSLNVFSTAYGFLKAHPHPIHIIFWSIFFGPIIILMPCLLVLEIIILVLFHLNFITHGLLPGSPGDKFESLKEHFMESRESLFAYVESATAKFNKWTVDSPPLLVARLMAGILGFLVFIGIWNGWW